MAAVAKGFDVCAPRWWKTDLQDAIRDALAEYLKDKAQPRTEPAVQANNGG